MTHAYAGAARKGGAEIYRETRVTDLAQRADGTWDVVTEKGTVHAEHVVNAAGLWAREVGLMAGVVHPFAPMEHQYVVTDEVHEIAQSRGRDAPRHRLRRGALHAPGGPGRARRHLREARTAVVRAHDPVGLRPRAAARRLEPDRRQPHARLRALPGAREGRTQADHQRPPSPSPRSGNPLVGPVPEVRNYWAALRRAGGLQPGGRGRPRARQLDDRRRSGHGHMGDGRRPVRRLGGARVLAGDGPPDLRHPASWCRSPTRSARPAARCAAPPSTTA